MATLIGERRRGTLPLVATLKYHDPAMWPVHVAARRFHPLAIRRTGPRQPLNPPCISASYSVPRRNIFLLISIAYHRRYGRAVWIDPVVLRAITIPWNNIIIPVRSCPYHGHPDDLPWFTNDFGLLRMRCGTERPQVTKHQGRSESYGHYPHASTSLPQRQINEHAS